MPRLRVVAGPSTSDTAPITVNTGTPHRIVSDSFDGHILAHIKDFPGSDGNVVNSDYFDREDRRGITWSIQVQGRFLKPLSADDILFGNTFDRPLNLPWGSSAAFRFMKYIDPTLDHDLASKTKPWALSPLISTMPHFAHSRPESEDALNVPPSFPSDRSLTDDVSQLHLATLDPYSASPSSSPSPSPSPSPSSSRASSQASLPQTSDESPAEGPGEKKKKKNRLSVSSIKAKLPVGSASEARQARKAKRRKEREERMQAAREAGVKEVDIVASGGRQSYFANQVNRQNVVFGPEDVITTDFCYGFLTFAPKLALNLPGGISFDLMHYWDRQPVRFVCCERKPPVEGVEDEDEDDDPWGKILWCVAIELIEDEEAELQ